MEVLKEDNEKLDQEVKILVRDEVQNYMSTILQNVDDIDVSREIISSNLSHTPRVGMIYSSPIKSATYSFASNLSTIFV